MQTEKVDKNLINTEVTVLADLKEKYKAVAGKGWSLKEGYDIDEHFRKYVDGLYSKISAQESRLAELKEPKKGGRESVDSQAKILLELKKEYKEATGIEYQPRSNKTQSEIQLGVPSGGNAMEQKGREIHEKIVEQGNKIRKLKADKCSKEVVSFLKFQYFSFNLKNGSLAGSEGLRPRGPLSYTLFVYCWGHRNSSLLHSSRMPLTLTSFVWFGT